MTRTQVLALIFLVATVAGTSDQQPNRDQVEQHFRTGEQAMREGHFEQAVQEFGKAVKLDPGLSQARINLGLALHLRGDFRRAVAELKEGLKQNPDVLGANIALGVDELKLGFPPGPFDPFGER